MSRAKRKKQYTIKCHIIHIRNSMVYSRAQKVMRRASGFGVESADDFPKSVRASRHFLGVTCTSLGTKMMVRYLA